MQTSAEQDINGRSRGTGAVRFTPCALELASLGLHVFPLKPGDKVPAISKAAGGNGLYDATTDADAIETWGRLYPNANIGVRTGAESGIIVIDTDPRNGSVETLKAWAANGHILPKTTPRDRTGNGGHHYIFKYEAGICCSTEALGAGIDVKSDGGYVVAPSSFTRPSKSGSGGLYEWEVSPHEADFHPMPAWLLEKIRASAGPAKNAGSTRRMPDADRDAVAEVESALSHISPEDRDDWRRVGQALYHSLGDGRRIWDRWAAGSSKYDTKDQDRVWQSFEKSKATGLASIFQLARRSGADLSSIAREHRENGPHREASGSTASPSAKNETPPNEPIPLVRPLAPADPYPLDSLGLEIEAVTRALHDIVQSPLAMCASTLLATVTLAAQAHVNVVLPVGDGLERPVSSNFVTVGRSGERKSATDDLAMRAVRAREDELRGDHFVEHRAWKDAHDAWEAERKSILSRKGDKAGKRADLARLGPEPAAPLVPIVVMAEATIEGLAKLLMNGQPSVGVFSAEGGQFVGGHALSDDAKLRTAAALSQLWDGVTWKRVRSLDGANTIAHRRVSMNLMVQPDVAAALVNDPVLRDQGLLSRMLVCFPATTMGTRLHRQPAAESLQTLSRFTARLQAALALPLPLREGKRNELAPRRLKLSPEARAIWIEFTDHIERMIGPGGLLEPISGFAAKMGEHAARLAAVITWWGKHDAREVDADALKGAIRLVEHYGEEALRLYQSSVVPPDIAEAQRLLEWLRATWRGPAISVPDISQRGPNSLRVAKRAREMVAVLVDHGWLVRLPEGAEIDGKRRREAWSIQRGN